MFIFFSLLQVFDSIPVQFLNNIRNPCWKEETNIFCLPSFFLAGFPKAGTTDLWAKIVRHPDIVATIKEPHWWTRRRVGEDSKIVTSLPPPSLSLPSYLPPSLPTSLPTFLPPSLNIFTNRLIIFGIESTRSHMIERNSAVTRVLPTELSIARLPLCLHHHLCPAKERFSFQHGHKPTCHSSE